MAKQRANLVEHAQRLNVALALLESHPPAAAASVLADAHRVSERQARRYVRQAQRLSGPVEVPEPSEVFTVRLPVSLIARLREAAAARKESISGVTAKALAEGLGAQRRRRDGTAR